MGQKYVARVTGQRDWQAEAAALLAEFVPNDLPLRALKVELCRDESEWFVRGWEADIYPSVPAPRLA